MNLLPSCVFAAAVTPGTEIWWVLAFTMAAATMLLIAMALAFLFTASAVEAIRRLTKLP